MVPATWEDVEESVCGLFGFGSLCMGVSVLQRRLVGDTWCVRVVVGR